MRQFYLSRNNSGYYKVIFVDPKTGALSVGKSTHTKDKIEAAVMASEWLKNSVPNARSNSRKFNAASDKTSVDILNIASRLEKQEALELIALLTKKFNLNISDAKAETVTPSGEEKTLQKPQKKAARPASIKLIPYLLEFWNFEKSEFIKRHLAYGHSMTKRHTDMMLGLVRNYWQPYFGDDITIQELDRTDLDDFFFYLHSEKELKGGTVNKAINCGSRCMRWLYDNKRIESNPMAGVERFNAEELERGIPTESEVRQLLKVDWSNNAYKLAFKLGAFCGLRAGEISGLRVCDLDLESDLIHVRHSWSDVDGLKLPKNSDKRDLPIDHQTLVQLYAQAKTNPQFSDLSYVFFSPVKPEQPYWPSYYVDGLYEALEKIGVSQEQRKERNIVFHSLRHFCATILGQRADLKTVQAVMGHRSEDMSKHYSNHETQEKLENMRNIMQVTWDNILSA
ncbi:Site-specific recombinase XerD [Treponema sp. JC4]|uniref:tyrosine-type recombinase/integrase n=1 Tax=Treponema sp. JC4 TaxID=1124982 RepID=UPI00025AFD56|nr:site-specific integrase [Treponema sp. JC4]EID85038.1 Site-specific recombinase XerD [Treponema sp. JC4]